MTPTLKPKSKPASSTSPDRRVLGPTREEGVASDYIA